jgi:hypothetical protein
MPPAPCRPCAFDRPTAFVVPHCRVEQPRLQHEDEDRGVPTLAHAPQDGLVALPGQLVPALVVLVDVRLVDQIAVRARPLQDLLPLRLRSTMRYPSSSLLFHTTSPTVLVPLVATIAYCGFLILKLPAS